MGAYVDKIFDMLRNKFGGGPTKVKVKYNAGFGNNLFIRGEGAGLSWEKGVPMKNVATDRWEWETNHPFDKCLFKILINDVRYEKGENHQVFLAKTIEIAPRF